MLFAVFKKKKKNATVNERTKTYYVISVNNVL